MFEGLRAIWQPAMYHGHHRRRHFFEGWYFKLADAPEEHLYAVIPGVFLGTGSGEAHSFVQVLDGRTGRSLYHRYPIAEFWSSPRRFELAVGPNRFTADQIHLNIDRPEQRVRGDLRFEGRTPWAVTGLSPGAMGWYAFVPFMECSHGVLSFDHRIAGSLQVDGRVIDFSGGRGYIEKDWGQAFPRAWVWLQSNHFDKSGTSLTASVATIPWLGSSFRGFIIGLWHQGRLYRFTTYTRASLERLELSDSRVLLTVSDGSHRLEVEALRAEGGLLHGPSRTEMSPRVLESLTSTVRLRLFAKRDEQERLLFSGEGRNAGLEINGRLEEILDRRPS